MADLFDVLGCSRLAMCEYIESMRGVCSYVRAGKKEKKNVCTVEFIIYPYVKMCWRQRCVGPDKKRQSGGEEMAAAISFGDSYQNQQDLQLEAPTRTDTHLQTSARVALGLCVYLDAAMAVQRRFFCL